MWLCVQSVRFSNFGTFKVRLRFLRLFEAGEGWFWEWEHEIICSQFALIWSKGFEIGLLLWFYPDLAQNQRARDHALWLGRFFFPLPQSRTALGRSRYCITGLETFFFILIGSHMSYSFSQRENSKALFLRPRSNGGYFCRCAGGGFSNNDGGKHQKGAALLSEVISKRNGPLLPKLNLIIKTSYKYSPI